MHHFTHLGRPIDFRYASNRQAVAVTIAAGLVILAGDVATTGLTSASWSAAARGAAASFLAWGLGRELDPDAPITATLAAVMSIGTTLWVGSPDLLLMVGVLFVARILLRPAGHPPRRLDLVGLLVLGVLLGVRAGGWGVALVLAFAVARDRRLPGAVPRFSRVIAATIAAGATGLAIQSGTGFWVTPSIRSWAVVGIGLLAAVTTPPRPSLTALADLTRAPLEPRRLASARRVTVVGLVCAAVFGGNPGIVGLAPGWSAVLAVALVHHGFIPTGGTPEPR